MVVDGGLVPYRYRSEQQLYVLFYPGYPATRAIYPTLPILWFFTTDIHAFPTHPGAKLCSANANSSDGGHPVHITGYVVCCSRPL